MTKQYHIHHNKKNSLFFLADRGNQGHDGIGDGKNGFGVTARS